MGIASVICTGLWNQKISTRTVKQSTLPHYLNSQDFSVEVEIGSVGVENQTTMREQAARGYSNSRIFVEDKGHELPGILVFLCQLADLAGRASI